MFIALERASALGSFGEIIDRASTPRGKTPRGFAHAELVFSNGESLTALTDAGLVIHRRSFPAKDWVWYDIGEDLGGDGAVRALAAPELGSRYDWGAVFKWVIPFSPQNPHEWMCSEAVTELGLQRPFGIFTDFNSWHTSPNDLDERCQLVRFPSSLGPD